ncbi:MAG: hypothetical protein NTX73_17770 [Rhodobacterales bacterium]|jgi:hypothetical protein|nr:hypothetical protein [Rhodobacterales bacterium]
MHRRSDLGGVSEGTAGADVIDANNKGDPEGGQIGNFDSLENFTEQTLL